MTAPTALPHIDAVQSALEAAGLTVYLGGAPTSPPDKFTVIYPEPGQAVRESLADQRTDFTVIVQITCVGSTPERALWVADKVRAAMSAPLAVAGRNAWRPEDQGGPPLQRDDDVNPPLYYLPVEYLLQSTA